MNAMSRLLPVLLAPVLLSAVEVEGPWARATAPGAQAGAVFATLRGGAEGDRLVGAACAVADTVELHTHVRDADGVMRMRPVDAIPVPAGGAAVLRPGAEHVMLIGLRRALVEGERLPLELTFARAGRREVLVQVGAATADAAPAPAGSASPATGGCCAHR